MDYTTLTDKELEQTRIDVANEQERRQRLSALPEQVREFVLQYHEDGGDVFALQDAVVNALTPIVGPKPDDSPDAAPPPVLDGGQ